MRGCLRQATLEDMDLLFQWANEPSVRNNSFSTESIPYGEHKKWFEDLMARADRAQYIYLYDGEAVGQARIDISGEAAEIAYSICASKRGMGHGKNLLQLLHKQVREDFPEIKKLIGKVKPDNIASQRAFLDNGYKEIYEAYEISMDQDREYSENITGGGVLYLTNNKCSLALYDWLSERETVHLHSGRLVVEQLEEARPELIVSYNYKYMIGTDIIEYMKGNCINLHISYLPWNRGSSPNFWSFVEDTPKGVTIHQVSAGLDRGKILYQKECVLEAHKETFASAYSKLQMAMTELFKENWEDIKEGKYSLKEQREGGSYHTLKDLEKLYLEVPFRWSDNIKDFLDRYQLSKESS